MKRLTFMLLIMAIIIVGCSQATQVPIPTQDIKAIGTQISSTMIAGAVQTQQAMITPTISEGISIDAGLLNVDITLPASLFSDEDMSTFDVDAYANKNGFKKAVINEDGSITITVSKSKYKEMLEEAAADLNKTFYEMIGSENTPYITGLTSNSDFTSIIVDVDKVGYESAFDLTPFTIGISSMFYQAIAGVEYHCEITIRDGATKETITSFIYPDAMQ